METHITEQQIQTKIIKRLKKDGFIVIKLIKASPNGYPDLIAVKENETIFIEVKKPKGVLSELQKVRIKELRSKNINVKVWHDFEQEFQK
jgi:Holliday junction resolvase